MSYFVRRCDAESSAAAHRRTARRTSSVASSARVDARVDADVDVDADVVAARADVVSERSLPMPGHSWTVLWVSHNVSSERSLDGSTQTLAKGPTG